MWLLDLRWSIWLRDKETAIQKHAEISISWRGVGQTFCQRIATCQRNVPRSDAGTRTRTTSRYLPNFVINGHIPPELQYGYSHIHLESARRGEEEFEIMCSVYFGIDGIRRKVIEWPILLWMSRNRNTSLWIASSFGSVSMAPDAFIRHCTIAVWQIRSEANGMEMK